MSVIRVFSFVLLFVSTIFGADDTRMQNAIIANNVAALQKLYEAKTDFNKPLENGKLPIAIAMFDKQREKSARFLLEHGVDKNTLYDGKSILFDAVQNHFSEEFVSYLIAIGCDRNHYSSRFAASNGNNPYVYASVYRKDFYSKELLKALKPTEYKNIKLAYLYLKNRLYEELREFVEHTEDVGIFERDDYVNFLSELTRVYPLYVNELSAQQKEESIKTMELLIKKGADLNKTTMDNANSFDNIVFKRGFPKEFVTFALTYGEPNKKYFIGMRKTNWSPLFGAISAKNIEAVDILIKKGADVNYTDEDGLDAFYLAIYSAQIDVAKKLIRAGFKPNLTPTGKRHPLAIAVLNNDIKTLEYLTSIGYDIHKELFGKKNILEFALSSPNKDIGRKEYFLTLNLQMYKYLFEAFKDELNTPRKIGYHDLLLTDVGKDAFEAFKILLDMGIDIHTNNNGYSPLQFLAGDDYFFDKVRLLVDKKVDLNNQDKDGDTPLHQFVIYYASTQKELEKIKNERNEKKTAKYDDVESILMLVGYNKAALMQKQYITSMQTFKKSIKYLIEHGANKTIKNKQNRTPYELAISDGIDDKELLGWLLKI